MLSLPRGTVLPYFTAGWPDEESFLASVCGAARAGCPAFEVGIPFSDPVADGPVIQRTSSQALERGVDWGRALELTREATRQSGLPAIAMTYCNLLYSAGLQRAAQELAESGVRGLIVPDLTLEEGEVFEAAASQAGIDLIYLVAPTTPEARVEHLARRSRGFLYLVSVRGVTGERRQLASDLPQQIQRVVSRCSIPVLVGFGISTPEQAAQVGAHCHGVIVGSALLSRLEGLSAEAAGRFCEEYLGQLVQAVSDSSRVN